MRIRPARRTLAGSLGTTLLVVGLTAAGLPAAYANGGGGRTAGGGGLTALEPPTRFEAFVASACSPCVQDAYAVATLPVAPLRLPAFTRALARPGEVRFEVVRAYPLGRASQQFLAVRGTLFVGGEASPLLVGGAASPAYRFASGLVDEADFPRLTAAVSAMAAALVTGASGEPAPDTTEVEAHAGSIRVGAIRIAEGAAAYVQLADPRLVRPPSPTDAQGTMFFPVAELPRLQQVLEQVVARMEKLRGK